jgi:hypothetical protein
MIAVKAMAGVIDEQRYFRMSLSDLFDFLRSNVSILGAEVHHHHGTARRLHNVFRNLATVIADRGCGVESSGGEPR